MKRLLAVVLAGWVFAVFAQFAPIQAMPQGTKTVSCTTGGVTATLALPSDQMQRQAEVSNAGTATVFVEFGPSTVAAATASGYPVLAGQTKVVTIPQTATTVACISASGTQTVYVTVGVGQ